MGRSAGGIIGTIIGAVIGSPGGPPGIIAGAFVGDFAGTSIQQAVEDRPVRVGEDLKGAAIVGGSAAVLQGIALAVTPTPPAVGIEPAPIVDVNGALVNAPVPPEATVAGTVTGPTGSEETILVSRVGQAAPGTSLSHVALDTSLYQPGDVAGPLIDFGPGTNLTATLPEGQAALDAARGNVYPGFLEGPGTYLTSGIPEFGLPATPNDVYGSNIPTEKKPGWWTQAAGAAAGQTLAGGINSFFQAGLKRLEQVLGILPKPSESTVIAGHGGGSGGGGSGGGGKAAIPNANELMKWGIWIILALLIVLMVMRVKR